MMVWNTVDVCFDDVTTDGGNVTQEPDGGET